MLGSERIRDDPAGERRSAVTRLPTQLASMRESAHSASPRSPAVSSAEESSDSIRARIPPVWKRVLEVMLLGPQQPDQDDQGVAQRAALARPLPRRRPRGRRRRR